MVPRHDGARVLDAVDELHDRNQRWPVSRTKP
jgi:hypothetical protein